MYSEQDETQRVAYITTCSVDSFPVDVCRLRLDGKNRPQRNWQTFWQLINYRRGTTRRTAILLVTLLVLVVGMAGMYLAGFLLYGNMLYAPPVIIAPIAKWIAIINIVLLPVSTTFAEDGLYLGCGVNQIKNKYAAILVPTFCLCRCLSRVSGSWAGIFLLGYATAIPLYAVSAQFGRVIRPHVAVYSYSATACGCSSIGTIVSSWTGCCSQT
ncbi:MAG: hypothetical protein IJT12_06700 [Paludibacteraceae bacterium]|nr:hypothetical protein [Paludibacteraceae bacterium]